MVKFSNVVLLSLLLALAAYATGPVAPAPEDVSSGIYADPLLSPWGLDVVTWVQQPNAPVTFRRAASAAIGNYWYCFGDQNVVPGNAFNLTTLQWEASTPPPLGNCNWTGLAINGSIYIVGRYPYATDVQKFTPTGGGPTGTWTTVAPYPIAGCGIGAAWDGGDFIYAAGGNPAPSTAAHKYSISANTWTPIASLPISMAYCGGAFAMGKFYVMGGIAAAASTALYEYDPVANTWTPKAPVPIAVWFGTFSVSNDPGMTKVYSIGGGGGSGSWPSTDAVQIYDPVTNTWTQETPLPVAIWGVNSADYCFDGMAMSAGGYNGSTNTNITYQGTGFGGGGTPNVTVTLLPVNPPITIPPTGGTFEWDITLVNNEASAQTIDIWNIISGPATRLAWGPLLDFTMAAGATINRIRPQYVSDRYPAGAYTYTSNIGDYPSTIWDSDSFPYTKSAIGADGWASSQPTTGLIPTEYAVHGASPNPFNPTTTLGLDLPQAGSVKLTIYNVSGQEVATLVNGWRDAGIHEVTFDATGLASGLYVYQLTAGDFHASGKMMLTK